MANPTIAVLTDGFGSGTGSPARANTPTGSTTGLYGTAQSSWGVGNGWIDIIGGRFNLANSQATCAGNTNTFNFLMQDPNLTQTVNQRIAVTTAALPAGNTNQTWIAIVRGQPNTDGYVAVLSNTQFYIAKLTGGNNTVTNLGTATYTYVTGHQYRLDLQATGDGATTTALVANLYDVTAGGGAVATVTVTADTTAEFQSGGRVGLGCYNNTASTLGFTQVIVYSDTTLPFARIPLGLVGDSLTYSLSTTLAATGDIICRILNARTLNVQYYPVNMGFSGAQASSFSVGNASGYLAATLQNFQNLGVKTYFLMLGSNDAIQSTTPAAYQANMQALINNIAAACPGITCFTNFPPYLDWVRFYNAFGAPTSAATLPLLRSYLPYWQQLTGCVLGDTAANTTFQNVDFYGLTDGGHSNDQGSPPLVSLWINQAFPYAYGGTASGPKLQSQPFKPAGTT